MEDSFDYTSIERPYNDLLDRSGISPINAQNATSLNGNVQEATVKSDGAMSDIWITNFIRSVNWKPKRVGFYINGQTGYAEFTDIFIKGSITGSSLNIPDSVTVNSFHVDSSGNTWWGTNISTGYATAPAKILNTGAATFSSITINGGVIDGTSTVGGRTASVLATAINSAGAFINSNLDTSAKTILGSFTFGASGAIAMNTDVNNGLWLSPTGILGKKAGVTTFAVDTSGNATFTGTIAASQVQAGTLNAFTITGSTITGSTLTTATSGQRVVLTSTLQSFYNSSGTEIVEIYANSSSFLVKGMQSTSSIALDCGSSGGIVFMNNGTNIVTVDSSSMYPSADSSFTLGSVIRYWSDSYVQVGHFGTLVYSPEYNSGNSSTVINCTSTVLIKVGGTTKATFGNNLQVEGYLYSPNSQIIYLGAYNLNMNGTNKTAIVPTLKGYNALYCTESPEVWFMDFCGKDKILDSMFKEVTVGPYRYIKCEDGGFQVWGKRKGHEEKRFEKRSEKEFVANERFLNMNKPY